MKYNAQIIIFTSDNVFSSTNTYTVIDLSADIFNYEVYLTTYARLLQLNSPAGNKNTNFADLLLYSHTTTIYDVILHLFQSTVSSVSHFAKKIITELHDMQKL